MSELDRLLAEARELEPEPLDAEATARAVTHAAVTGRARHRAWVLRRVLGAVTVGAAMAAAAALFLAPTIPDEASPVIPATQPAPVAAATTPERGRTDLELPTGDRVRAEEGARFHVELSTEWERRVRLTSGSMLFDVRPLPGGRFTVRTPSAEIIVLGTVFTVTVEREGTVVRVYEGRVEVRRDERVEQVSAGGSTRFGETSAAEDPLAGDARRAARERRAPPPEPAVVTPPRPRRTREASATDVRAWIAEGQAQRALDVARRHVDQGDVDPWLLLEADALRALSRPDEAADAYARAAERLPSPRAEQAGFASARLRSDPALALRALDAGRVTAPASPLRERGLALRVDLLGRLGRDVERTQAARTYLSSYPQGSRAAAMRALIGEAVDP